jgi:PEP-CTERM motif
LTVQGTTPGSALAIQSGVTNAIDDGATVNLFGGGAAGVADQGYADLGAGINEIIGSLFLNGVMQPSGTYGSSLSNATNKLDEYFAGAGILSIIAPLFAGDYNDDGVVDASDYVVWQKNVGQPAGTLPNDNTGVAIGDAQYNLWKSNFGNAEAGSGVGSAKSASVPEPATALLLLVMGLHVTCCRRRTRCL